MIKIKIKNLSNESNVYRIKLDNQIIDSGIVDNDVIELQYALPFSDTKTHYVSISFKKGDCRLIVQEIELVKSRRIMKSEDGITGATCTDVTKVMNHDYSDIKGSAEIGGNKEWIFLVENNDHLVFWNGDNNSFCDRALWVPDPLNGNHTFDFSDGRIYEGEFVNNKMHGKGMMTFASGKISNILGFFDEDEDVAYISDFIYRNGDTLKLLDSSFSVINPRECMTIDPKEISVPGTQCYTWYNDTVDFKDTYTGDFINGELDGQGSLSFKNPSPYLKYEGTFVDGEWEGFGKLYYRNGDVLEGSWRSGQRGKGDGTIEFKSGPFLKYVGWFENNIPHGEGELRYRNGDVFYGNVIKGIPDSKTYRQMNFSSGEVLAIRGSVFDMATGETANHKSDFNIETWTNIHFPFVTNPFTSILFKDSTWLTTTDSVNIKDISLKRFNCKGSYFYIDEEFLVAVWGVWEEGKINPNHDIEVFYYDYNDKLKSILDPAKPDGTLNIDEENLVNKYIVGWAYPLSDRPLYPEDNPYKLDQAYMDLNNAFWIKDEGDEYDGTLLPIIHIINNKITYNRAVSDRPINMDEFIAHNQYLDTSIEYVNSVFITEDGVEFLLYQPK